nr:PREDICTED: serine/arginine repetitive matrix protein 2-like [Equus przewalskii]
MGRRLLPFPGNKLNKNRPPASACSLFPPHCLVCCSAPHSLRTSPPHLERAAPPRVAPAAPPDVSPEGKNVHKRLWPRRPRGSVLLPGHTLPHPPHSALRLPRGWTCLRTPPPSLCGKQAARRRARRAARERSRRAAGSGDVRRERGGAGARTEVEGGGRDRARKSRGGRDRARRSERADGAWERARKSEVAGRGAAHGGRGRADGESSARRPVAAVPAVARSAPGAPGGLRPGIRVCSGRGDPRTPRASPLPLPRKNHEEATTHVGRSRKGGRCPPWAEGAGTQTSSGFRATRSAGPAPCHFLRDRVRHGPEAPRGEAHPGRPSSSPGPRSREPATSTHPRGSEPRLPLTCCQDLGLARPRGGAAHLVQVRSGDSPGGGGRKPALTLAPEAQAYTVGVGGGGGGSEPWLLGTSNS